MRNKILIVEDESSIRGFLKLSFKSGGYTVIEAETGEQALEKARLERPDIVVLDIMLPGIDGYKVCEILRQELPRVGIIMLTARSQDMDKIMGLQYGADDYIIKPFNPTELLLRVKALERRVVKQSSGRSKRFIEYPPFKIDTYSRKVYKNERELNLTPKEYLLIKKFMEESGKAFSRDELLDLVWGNDFVGDPKIVDVNIRRMRKKIEQDPSNPQHIETVWGIGYRWKK